MAGFPLLVKNVSTFSTTDEMNKSNLCMVKNSPFYLHVVAWLYIYICNLAVHSKVIHLLDSVNTMFNH